MKSSKESYIHISPHYALQGDELNVTLYKKRIVEKTGETQFDPIAYFPSLDKALHRVIDLDLGPVNNLKLVLDRIEELKKYISESILDRISGDKRLRSTRLCTLRMKCLECEEIKKPI